MGLGYPFSLLTNIWYGIYVFLLASNISTPSLPSIGWKATVLRFAKETEPVCFIDIYLLQRTGSHAFGSW